MRPIFSLIFLPLYMVSVMALQNDTTTPVVPAVVALQPFIAQSGSERQGWMILPVQWETEVRQVVRQVMTITAYSCSESQGTSGCRMRNGQRPFEGAVASNNLPAGTVVWLPEIEFEGIVLDTGGGLEAVHIDRYFERYEDAIQFGRKRLIVEVQP